MTRTATFLTIALVSSLATPLVVSASTAPKSAAPAAATMVATASVATPAPVATPAVLAQPAQADTGCAKRVRVVYQGYGPVNGACTAAR